MLLFQLIVVKVSGRGSLLDGTSTIKHSTIMKGPDRGKHFTRLGQKTVELTPDLLQKMVASEAAEH